MKILKEKFSVKKKLRDTIVIFINYFFDTYSEKDEKNRFFKFRNSWNFYFAISRQYTTHLSK